jgi:hypothetical protein
VTIVLSVLLMVGTLFNNLTNTRVQLATDIANASMMNFLVQNTAPDSTIYINIQDTNEYYYEIQTQMGLEGGRPDLTINTFNPSVNLIGAPGTIYIISPFVENQPLLTVRMGVVEETQIHWNQSLKDFLHSFPGSQVVFETSETFRLSDINYPQVFCPLVKTRSFCAMSVPFLDQRAFNYGWQVIRVQQP